MYAEALESYTIIEDPDLIAVESFIYSAFESDMSAVKKLKAKLTKLAKAKSKNDKEEVAEAKREVDDAVEDLNEAANDEADARKKAKMKKLAKAGAITAGAIATVATIATVAKKIRDGKDRKAEISRRVEEKYGDLIAEGGISDDDAKRAADSVKERFEKSVKTAKASGVSDDKILKTKKDIDNYFTNNAAVKKKDAVITKNLEDFGKLYNEIINGNF
jgi:hypothetical protein